MSSFAPIVITVYDRLDHLKRCINALLSNPEASFSKLYVLSDAPYKNEHTDRIQEVRHYILSIKGFKEIIPIFSKYNKGAHASLTEGISALLQHSEEFIFLEDDIVISPNFLQYMNAGLQYYKEDKKVFAVCGFKAQFKLPQSYEKDIYFYPCNSPWGFATWKDRWESINFDYYDRYAELKKDKKKYKQFASIGFYIKGILQTDSRKEIIATDLRIYYHMFQKGMYSVFPTISKTQNWGFDGTGEHCGNQDYWWAKPELDTSIKPITFEPFTGYDEELLHNHRVFQDKINGGFLAKHLKYTWVHEVWKFIKKKINKLL